MDKDALFWPEDKCDTSILVEVRRYFVDPPVLHSDDPLQWSHKNESCFLMLPSLLERTSLFLQPSEQVFSAAGNIMTKKIAALSPENVNTLRTGLCSSNCPPLLINMSK